AASQTWETSVARALNGQLDMGMSDGRFPKRCSVGDMPCSTAAPRRTGPVGTVFPSDLQYKRKGSARQLWDGMSNAFVCILRYIAPLHSLTMPMACRGSRPHADFQAATSSKKYRNASSKCG